MNKSTDLIEELNSKFRFISSETYNVRDRLSVSFEALLDKICVNLTEANERTKLNKQKELLFKQISIDRLDKLWQIEELSMKLMKTLTEENNLLGWFKANLSYIKAKKLLYKERSATVSSLIKYKPCESIVNVYEFTFGELKFRNDFDCITHVAYFQLFQSRNIFFYYNIIKKKIKSAYFAFLPHKRYLYFETLENNEGASQLLILNRSFNMLHSNSFSTKGYYNFIIKYYDGRIYLFFTLSTLSSSSMCNVYDSKLKLIRNKVVIRNKAQIKKIFIFNDEIWVHDYDRLFKLNLDFNELDTILRKKLMDHNDLLVNVDDDKFFFLNKGSNSFQFYLKIFNKSNAQLIKTFSFNRECLTPNCFVNNYKYIGFDDKSNIFIFYESCILVYDSNGKFLFKKNDYSFLDIDILFLQ